MKSVSTFDPSSSSDFCLILSSKVVSVQPNPQDSLKYKYISTSNILISLCSINQRCLMCQNKPLPHLKHCKYSRFNYKIDGWRRLDCPIRLLLDAAFEGAFRKRRRRTLKDADPEVKHWHRDGRWGRKTTSCVPIDLEDLETTFFKKKKKYSDGLTGN